VAYDVSILSYIIIRMLLKNIDNIIEKIETMNEYMNIWKYYLYQTITEKKCAEVRIK